TIGETVADLGGFSCMLEMAKGYENFDYELFFKTYARVWPQQAPVEMQEMQLQDVHAPGYLRTNVTVQQFQEFYDTFGITPNDGMYLAPEQRLSVW
ncbi:MAG: M13-type metalloendopeptidase, partial [Clostridia bacterium]